MPLKTAVFTSSGTWSVPSTVSAIWIMELAGGAGGAGNPTSLYVPGQCGGGGGEYTIGRMFPVTPSGSVSIVIGAGGTGGPGGGGPGFNGGNSSVAGVTVLGGVTTTDGTNHGDGGGPKGGLSFFSGSAVRNINNGTAESPTAFGGCGAGLGGSDGGTEGGMLGFDGNRGQVIGQYDSGTGVAVPSCHGGGGPGAPSVFGIGGSGGSANDSNSGAGGSTTAKGTGGGGACGTGPCTPARVNLGGGHGAHGWAMIMWTEPT